MSPSLDAVWAEMNADVPSVKLKKSSTTTKKSKKTSSGSGNAVVKSSEDLLSAILRGVEVNEGDDVPQTKKGKKKTTGEVNTTSDNKTVKSRQKKSSSDEVSASSSTNPPLRPRRAEVLGGLLDESLGVRKEALHAVKVYLAWQASHMAKLEKLAEEAPEATSELVSMTSAENETTPAVTNRSAWQSAVSDWDSYFIELCKPILRGFADSSEKIRDMSQQIMTSFFTSAHDLVPTLPYFFPALMQRLPPGITYDETTSLFVNDVEAHEAYKRGRAVDRQDKQHMLGPVSITVLEPSEEVRLATVRTVHKLVERVVQLGAAPVLHPYFSDLILFLQAQLSDPFPDIKILALETLGRLAQTPDFALGMKFFAVALVRVVLPSLRHRLSRVRIVAVETAHACMVVNDTAKRKAAGSEAIIDLVGFREENVLPVAAFYRPEVSVNYLAELVTDNCPNVRLALVRFLGALLTEIGDRYDHQTRLLPYLLDLLSDSIDEVASSAFEVLKKCGRQYEEDHYEELLEKRQYGVDGDARMNLQAPLPPPFTERPSLGLRCYVRGNTKRFLSALVNELTNWMAPTRLKSAGLLRSVIVLCEEHLTMEAHSFLPALMKALKFARDDRDTELERMLLETISLLGRYLNPEIYLFYMLPRLRGDAEVVAFGMDSETRVNAFDFLKALLHGSLATQILPHLDSIIDVICDPYVVPLDSPRVVSAATRLGLDLLRSLRGQGKELVAAHYLATGRLVSLKSRLQKLAAFSLVQLASLSLRDGAIELLVLLSSLEPDTTSDVAAFLSSHATALTREAMANFLLDDLWTENGHPETQVLLRLLECPAYPVQRNPALLGDVLAFLCSQVSTVPADFSSTDAAMNGGLKTLCEMLWRLLAPIALASVPQTESSIALVTMLYGDAVLTEETKLVTGLRGMLSEENRSVLLGVIRSQNVSLLTAFVESSRWDRTVELSFARLKTVALLFGGVFHFGTAEPSPKLALDSFWMSCLIDVADEEALLESRVASDSELLSHKEMISNFRSITEALLSTGLQLTAPTGLRFLTTTLINYATALLTSTPAMRRVRRFSADGETPAEVILVREACSVAIRAYRDALSDSCDEVRDVLFRGWPYLARAIGPDVAGESTAVTTLSEITTALFRQLMLESDVRYASSSDVGIIALDGVLRILAVRDPAAIEAVIRTALPDLDLPHQPRRNEVVNGLINHCDVLSSLA